MKLMRLGLLAGMFLVFIILITGCGGTGSQTSAAASMPAPTATPVPTPSPTPTPTQSPSSVEVVYSVETSLAGPLIFGFTLQPDLTLRPLPSLTSSFNVDALRLMETPDGSRLFSIASCSSTPCNGGAVFSHAINPDGTLGTPQMVIPVDQQIIDLAIDPTGHFVYALSQVLRVPPIDPSTGCSAIAQTLTAYSLGSNGALAPLHSSAATVNGNDCPAASGGFPETKIAGLHQDSSGTFLWLTQIQPGRGTADPFLLSLPIAADGTLGALQSTPAGKFTQTEHSVIAGQYLVTTENDFRMTIAPDTVTTFRLQGGTPQFASQCPASVPACHGVVALAAKGNVVYTLSGIDGSSPPSFAVNALSLDPTSGTLIPLGTSVPLPSTSIFAPSPDDLPPLLAVDFTQRFLFVARNADTNITTIPLDAITGGLGSPVTSNTHGSPGAMASTVR